jgi:hypothetical protein
MKIQMTTGCVCDSIEINGKEEIHLTNEERKEVAEHLAKYIAEHPETLNQILWHTIPLIGEYEDMGHCEECGDYIERYTVEL